MAVLDYYVDTAAAAGGNGTTSALSGASCAYQTLAAALAGLAQNLVTAGNSIVIHCAASGGAADTTAPSMSGWTTDSTHYLTIQTDVANRHAGIWDSTKYRLQTSSGTMFNSPPQYTRFIGLQLLSSADDINTFIWKLANSGTSSQGVQVRSCIARFTDKTYTYGLQGYFCGGVDETGDPAILANNLFYGGNGTHGRTGSGAIGSINGQGANCNIVAYNNTIIGFGAANDASSQAFIDGYSRIKAVNNLVTGYASWGNPGAAGTDYNAADVASVTGAHSRSSQTFTFVDAANKKYQLASGDTGAKGYGTDLSSDATYALTTDITGATRTTPWDIGAFIAASGGSSVSATGTAGEGEGATGAATQSVAATGSAGEGQRASGAATESVAATGSAGEGEGATGTATESIGGTGTGGEGGGASGAATQALAATGSAGEGQSASGVGAESVSATGSAGEGESVTGAATFPSNGSATGTAGSGAGASGSATESTGATGSAGQGGAGSGAGTLGMAGSGTAGQGERASGAASENIAATGVAGQAEGASGSATTTAPGAARTLSVVTVMRARYRVVTVIRPRFAAITILS